MEENEMEGLELTTVEVAAIFGVSPFTVLSWRQRGRLKGVLPRNAKRAGVRFKAINVRRFADEANDDGYSRRQWDNWWVHSRSAARGR